MKLKSALAAVIAFSTLGTAVQAASVRTEVKGTTVTLTATAVGNTKANIIVSRKGDINNNANIYEMIQVKADENGRIKHTFTIPEKRNGVSSYGEYNVAIKPENGNMLTGEFAYVTNDDVIDLMGAVTAEDADYNKIFAPDAQQRVSLKAVGCLMEQYDNLADKSDVIAAVEAGVTADTDSAGLVKIFNGAITMASITDSTTAKAALELYSPKLNDKSYVDFDKARQDYIAATICTYMPFDSPADFDAKYEKVNALYEVNSAKFDKMTDVLDTYKDVLGIENDDNYKDYLDLTSKKMVTANEELVTAFKKAYVKTTSELSDAIEDAVKVAKKSSGGSGSSSSGVSSGYVSAGPETISPQPGVTNAGNGEFTDLGSVSWAKEAILALKEKGIVSGTGDGQFNPNDPVTREAFTKMIVIAADVYTPGENVTFDDVSPDDWCYSYVASAFNNKLVYGISETTFGKGSNISRQDMAVIAYRAAKDSGKIHVGREMTTFSDDYLISDYAREAVEALYTTGVLNGSNGEMRPLSTATRAEASVIIYNLFVK